MQSYPKAKVPTRCTSYGWKRGSAHHCPQVDLIPCFDLNLRLRFDKQWTGRQIKSKHSIDSAPIPVFADDPTCYLNAWDFLT